MTDGVARPIKPSEALRMLEELLVDFREGDQLFVTARCQDSRLSMWRTNSKATGLYWCASALAKLWTSRRVLPRRDSVPLLSPSLR